VKPYLLRRFMSAVVLARTVASIVFPTDGLGAITVHGIRAAVPLDSLALASPPSITLSTGRPIASPPVTVNTLLPLSRSICDHRS